MTKLHFDPITIPVDSIAGETALTSERLALDWLRTRFANPPDWVPEVGDEQVAHWTTPPVRAAVLIPIVSRPHGPALLLTLRTEHLTAHAGQISFPGGRVETSDASAIDTALRETTEEIGLDRRHVEVLGAMPDYFTATGYQVTPVVGLVHPPFELTADPFEVAEIFEVPLAFLMDGMNHQKHTVDIPNGGRRTFYSMPYERFFIWGATAGMLRNLFHFLRA